MSDHDLTLTRPVRLPLVQAGTYKVATVLLGLVAAIVFGEIFLWLVLPPQDRFYVWPPHFQSTLHPNPDNLPGISGEARFKINSAGIRGEEFTLSASLLRHTMI